MDVVSKKKRSKMMSGIQGKDTNPELLIRKLLHKRGFRYKLHDNSLPGKPDMVFPKYKAVIHIHGCFWHKHDCHLFKWPSTRSEFWHEKLSKSSERDVANLQKLTDQGWKNLVVWECALKGKKRLPVLEIDRTITAWLINDPLNAEIAGR